LNDILTELKQISANTLLAAQALDGAIRHPLIGDPYFQVSATIDNTVAHPVPVFLEVPVPIDVNVINAELDVSFGNAVLHTIVDNTPLLVNVDSVPLEVLVTNTTPIPTSITNQPVFSVLNGTFDNPFYVVDRGYSTTSSAILPNSNVSVPPFTPLKAVTSIVSGYVGVQANSRVLTYTPVHLNALSNIDTGDSTGVILPMDSNVRAGFGASYDYTTGSSLFFGQPATRTSDGHTLPLTSNFPVLIPPAEEDQPSHSGLVSSPVLRAVQSAE
jgi:hypothetical protein